jgi:hypothetical protein
MEQSELILKEIHSIQYLMKKIDEKMQRISRIAKGEIIYRKTKKALFTEKECILNFK